MKIQIKSIFGSVKFKGDFFSLKEAVLSALKNGADLRGAELRDADLRGAELRGADLRDADLRDANLRGADLRGADLRDADLRGADLRGAELRDADLRGAELRGANLRGKKIKSIRIFSGLYRYTVFSILDSENIKYVKMGCLFYSLEEWEKIGILKSNENEFPDDGSRKSIERAEAFEFAKNAALKLV